MSRSRSSPLRLLLAQVFLGVATAIIWLPSALAGSDRAPNQPPVAATLPDLRQQGVPAGPPPANLDFKLPKPPSSSEMQERLDAQMRELQDLSNKLHPEQLPQQLDPRLVEQLTERVLTANQAALAANAWSLKKELTCSQAAASAAALRTMLASSPTPEQPGVLARRSLERREAEATAACHLDPCVPPDLGDFDLTHDYRPACRSHDFMVPASYEAFEANVRGWMSDCVMSRTPVAGTPIRRERDPELVPGERATLWGVWQRVRGRRGQQITLNATYLGERRAEEILYTSPQACGESPCDEIFMEDELVIGHPGEAIFMDEEVVTGQPGREYEQALRSESPLPPDAEEIAEPTLWDLVPQNCIKAFLKIDEDGIRFNLRSPQFTNLFSVKADGGIEFRGTRVGAGFDPQNLSRSVAGGRFIPIPSPLNDCFSITGGRLRLKWPVPSLQGLAVHAVMQAIQFYYRGILAGEEINRYKINIFGFADTLARMAADLNPDIRDERPRRPIDIDQSARAGCTMWERYHEEWYWQGSARAEQIIDELEELREPGEPYRSVGFLQWLRARYGTDRVVIREGILTDFFPQRSWDARAFRSRN